jgi:nucleotide-binding universal stress UspA family protein
MNRNTNNNILVPIDFSPIADNALTHAIKIAKVYNNEITLMYILEESFLGGLFSAGQNDVMIDAIKAKVALKAAEITAAHGIKVNHRVEKGKVYKTIAETANEEGFDSIIMGSSGASGLEQIVGSNASRTIQYSEVPVVVIKQSPIAEHGYKKIVMPIDLSMESRQKVDWAIHIGKKFKSEIHIVFSNSSDEYLSKRISGGVNIVKAQLEESGIQYVLHDLKDSILDNFANEVLQYSDAVKADLILVMTHTEKGIRELIIGTLTQQIVNKSEDIPVMCIYPHATGYTFDFMG